MYLADKVVQCRERVEVTLREQTWSLPGASEYSCELQECLTRYILFDDVREACFELVERWPDLLDASNPKLRAPMEQIWVEWAGLAGGGQVGVLVRAASDGRSGSLRVFWDDGTGVNAAQADVLFDFDQGLDFTRAHSRPLYGLHALPPEFTNLKRHLAVLIDSEWADYFRASALGPHGLAEASSLCGDGVWADVVLAMAFFVLLSSRLPLAERQVVRECLNLARVKQGRPPLLDHVELKLGLAPSIGTVQAGGSRKFPRMHMVRGHLVRRRDSVFWRSAHIRGGAITEPAMPPARHVRLA